MGRQADLVHPLLGSTGLNPLVQALLGLAHDVSYEHSLGYSPSSCQWLWDSDSELPVLSPPAVHTSVGSQSVPPTLPLASTGSTSGSRKRSLPATVTVPSTASPDHRLVELEAETTSPTANGSATAGVSLKVGPQEKADKCLQRISACVRDACSNATDHAAQVVHHVLRCVASLGALRRHGSVSPGPGSGSGSASPSDPAMDSFSAACVSLLTEEGAQAKLVLRALYREVLRAAKRDGEFKTGLTFSNAVAGEIQLGCRELDLRRVGHGTAVPSNRFLELVLVSVDQTGLSLGASARDTVSCTPSVLRCGRWSFKLKFKLSTQHSSSALHVRFACRPRRRSLFPCSPVRAKYTPVLCTLHSNKSAIGRLLGPWHPVP